MAKLSERISALKNEENADDIGSLMKSADELDNSNKQLYTRAKKAEGFEPKTETVDGKKVIKWAKKAEKKPEPKPTSPEAKQPDEPDYALDAFLEGRNIKNPDDNKLVKDEMKRLNLPAGDILEMEHIKTKLKDVKDQREAELGMPEGGKGKTSGSKSVDYWINRTKKDKDGTIIYDNPTDPKLHNEVIEARMKSDASQQMFDESLD